MLRPPRHTRNCREIIEADHQNKMAEHYRLAFEIVLQTMNFFFNSRRICKFDHAMLASTSSDDIFFFVFFFSFSVFVYPQTLTAKSHEHVATPIPLSATDIPVIRFS